MKLGLMKLSSVGIVSALMVTGCSNMTPGENAAVFGSVGGALAGGIAHAAGASTGESVAIGVASGAVIAATTYVIAKHQATERQRRVAEERARIYYARSEARRAELKRKRVRYIAVDTERNEKTSPKAKRSVMIWDTQSEKVVGNNVYDVESTPSVGKTAKFETYSAQYVGSGS